jgi:hypothetical protein
MSYISRRLDIRNALLFSITLFALTLFALSCADVNDSSLDPNAEGTFNAGKADITVGPIDKISCGIDSPFVRRGSYGSFKVEALDSSGAKSRNYSLTVDPQAGTRVIQRDQVVFDLEGQYEVQCCALDASESRSICDRVAVQVGSLHPALTVSVAPFSDEVTRVYGSAVDVLGAPAKVQINGQPVSVDEEGRFSMTANIQSGLNRFEVIATGGEGRQSEKRAWTIGGPFANINDLDPTALRVNLSALSLPTLEQILVGVLLKNINLYADSDRFREVKAGSALNYHWRLTPSEILRPEVELSLEISPRPSELNLRVNLPHFQILGNAETRFGNGEWRQGDVSVQGNFEISIDLGFHSGGIDLLNTDVKVSALELEIHDLPGVIEEILEFFLKGELQEALLDAIKQVGDKSLSDTLENFRVQEELTLPEPLFGSLDLEGRVSELTVNQDGILLGFGLYVDGETDPARVDAPGPLMSGMNLPYTPQGGPYEASLHIDLLNRLFFAAWQTGSLDFSMIMNDAIGNENDLITADDQLTLFMTPQLPPVVRMGPAQGELILELGALRMDGILDTTLGVWNCAINVGASVRAILSADQMGLRVSATTEMIEADVLIAPAQWELEPTRRYLEALIAKDVLPKYLEILRDLPLPDADISSLEISGIHALKIADLKVSSTSSGLNVGADLLLE